MLALQYRCGVIARLPSGKGFTHSIVSHLITTNLFPSPQLEYIDNLDAGMTNTGVYIISPANYRNRDNNATRDMQFGFIMINLTNPEHFSGLRISP